VTFHTLPADTKLEFEYEGITYETTLPVVLEFKVLYDMTNDKSGINSSTYRLGLKDERYFIVAPKPKK